MVKIYFDKDADLSVIKDRTIAIIGYGNQGRAWAHNMRDSGLEVIIGNIKDEFWKRAEEEGFKVYTITQAAEIGDVLCLLIPDEVQQTVYEKEIMDKLKMGDTLVFAHGFTIHYGQIRPPNYVDVLLVAPRMIGAGVRELFVKGYGAPAIVGIHQDASGKAKEVALAIAKAVGFTRAGVIESSFKDETELDLFSEQVIWPGILGIFLESYNILIEAGYSPEEVVLEMFASGEIIEVVKKIVELGLIKQLPLHSMTSQYGQLSRISRFITKDYVEKMKKGLEEIQTGYFAREWLTEQKLGYPVFMKLKEKAFNHPINRIEENIKKLMKLNYEIY